MGETAGVAKIVTKVNREAKEGELVIAQSNVGVVRFLEDLRLLKKREMCFLRT